MDTLTQIRAVAYHQHRALFLSRNLAGVCELLERQTYQQLDDLSDDKVLQSDPLQLAKHYASIHRVRVPRVIEAEISVGYPSPPNASAFDILRRAYAERGEDKGPTVEVRVPFEGPEGVFDFAVPSIDFPTPSAAVSHGSLVLTYTFHPDDDGEVAKQLENDLDVIRRCLELIEREATPFNERLHEKALVHLEERRSKLRRDRDLITSLGYPLRRREDAPDTYTVAMPRREIMIDAKPSLMPPRPLEPALDSAEYERILTIVSNMALVLERSPTAFRTLDEEDLRVHFLVQLNGQYEGQATGETFNFEGKTDILIRVNGRNIFIAECKFWGGPKVLRATVDQLLGYASWRDTKTAILFFNTNKNLTQVLQKIPEEILTHPNVVRALPYTSETGFRFMFRHRDDPERELLMTVLVFDVPRGDDSAVSAKD
jgi:hypothetical protein